MCIIYSSYIQHLTNKHKERQTTEKSTVGSEAQRRWELFECKWVPMSAPHAGQITGWDGYRRLAGRHRFCLAEWEPERSQTMPVHRSWPELTGREKTVKVELQFGEAAGVLLHQMYSFKWVLNFTLQKDRADLFWQTFSHVFGFHSARQAVRSQIRCL